MMRHFIFARPVPARPLRMFVPSATARLVASPSSVKRPPSRMGRTVGAVDVAPIAIAADTHRGSTICIRAQKKPGSWPIIMVATGAYVVRPQMPWTYAAVTAMMPLQSCLRTV